MLWLAQRAEAMLDAGLIEEVTHLRTLGIEKNPNAANAIGYRESLACFARRFGRK